MVQDPVIHYNFSPYNAFDNNPVFWADPSGADVTSLIQGLWNATPNDGLQYTYTFTSIDQGPLGPGSEFVSMDAVALDFAMLYNGASIINNVELKSLIYKKKNGKFSYTIPYGQLQYIKRERRGGSAGDILDELKPPKGSFIVASIHTHAADMSGRGFPPNSENELSSSDTYCALGWDGVIQEFVISKREIIYVVTPNGKVLVHDENSTDLTRRGKNDIGGKRIPIDPLSPTKISDVSPNVKPKIEPVVIDTDGSRAHLYYTFDENRKFHKNPDKERF